MDEKMRKGILQALVRFAQDEDKSMQRLRRRRYISLISACILLLAAFTFAFQESEQVAPWLYTLVAALGGIALGLSTWLDSSLATWPVLRNYLDLDRLRNTKP
jgi:hypothetical protein